MDIIIIIRLSSMTEKKRIYRLDFFARNIFFNEYNLWGQTYFSHLTAVWPILLMYALGFFVLSEQERNNRTKKNAVWYLYYPDMNWNGLNATFAHTHTNTNAYMQCQANSEKCDTIRKCTSYSGSMNRVNACVCVRKEEIEKKNIVAVLYKCSQYMDIDMTIHNNRRILF